VDCCEVGQLTGVPETALGGLAPISASTMPIGPKRTPTKNHEITFVAPRFWAMSTFAMPQTIQIRIAIE